MKRVRSVQLDNLIHFHPILTTMVGTNFDQICICNASTVMSLERIELKPLSRAASVFQLNLYRIK